MPHNRFYSPNLSELDKDELHHFKVMRLKEGDTIEVVNGLGDLAEAVLIDKKGHFEIAKIHKEQKPQPLILAQGLPKIQKLDFIVEKGTELGMTQLLLFPGDLSEKKKRLIINCSASIKLLYLP